MHLKFFRDIIAFHLNVNSLFHRFVQVEHEEQDEKKSVDVEKQIDKLEWVQERMRDDFAANQFLRGAFRVSRHIKLLSLQDNINYKHNFDRFIH